MTSQGVYYVRPYSFSKIFDQIHSKELDPHLTNNPNPSAMAIEDTSRLNV